MLPVRKSETLMCWLTSYSNLLRKFKKRTYYFENSFLQAAFLKKYFGKLAKWDKPFKDEIEHAITVLLCWVTEPGGGCVSIYRCACVCVFELDLTTPTTTINISAYGTLGYVMEFELCRVWRWVLSCGGVLLWMFNHKNLLTHPPLHCANRTSCQNAFWVV